MTVYLRDLSIDPVSRAVSRGQDEVRLPDLSFDLLLALVTAAPAALSVSQLSSLVWRDTKVSDETIAQRVTLLRKALGDDPKAPRYIRTVRGVGYAVVGQLASSKPITARLFSKGTRSKLRFGGVCAILGLGLATAIFVAAPQVPSFPQQTSSAQTLSHPTRLIQRARALLGVHQAAETDHAIQMLRRALSLAPESFEAQLNLSFALSTKATKFLGDQTEKAEAEALARALTSQTPSSSNAWNALGYALSAQGRPDEALAAYRQAIRRDADNAAALSSAAHLLLVKGEFQQALLLEARARKSGHTSRYGEIQIAQMLELMNEPSAVVWQSKALTLNPGQAVVLAEAARSQLRKGRPQAALKLLSQYHGAQDSAPQILVLNGRALVALGRTHEAEEFFARAGWRGHYGLAALYAAQGDWPIVINYFPPAKLVELAADPDPDLRVQLAEVYAAGGRRAEALQQVYAAVSLGWRDLNWLRHSPYLHDLMRSESGKAIGARIERELGAQRSLIATTQELAFIH